MLYRATHKGFTLIELIVSVTIMSFVMLSVFVIYSNILQTNKKLELNRILQENTRNMVEGLASEIRNKGISFDYYKTSTQLLDYSGSGNTQLAINNFANPIDAGVYCMQTASNFCNPDCYKSGTEKPQGCYLGKLNTEISLSDPRAEIDNLRFFISGKPSSTMTNEDKEGKVTMIFDISLAPGKGITPELAKANKLHIQTTISEKVYKNMK